MSPNPYNPNADTFPDLDGYGGTVGNPGGTPGSGPLELIQDGDPYTWELHNIGQGLTQYKHGLFGKLIDGEAYLFRRHNTVQSLGGTFQYTGNFSLGNSLAVLSVTSSTINGGTVSVCTVSSTEGMRAGSVVTIVGAVGATSINGTWNVYIISSTQFAIPVAPSGSYTASSATAKWAWSAWQFAQYMANNAAMTNVANSFGPNQSFAGNVVISGNLTVGGAATVPVFAPTEYFAPPVAKQTPAYTGNTDEDWYIADPGTPINPGTVDQTFTSIMKFISWGTGSGNQLLKIHLLPHSGSDSPEGTIVFKPASSAANFSIDDHQGGNTTIFETNGGSGAAGSVTVYWSNAPGTSPAWRVKSYSGIAATDLAQAPVY